MDLAVRAAEGAGALLLDRFGEPARGIGSKSSGTDMVSDADRDAEALIVDRILSARPDDAILGEERGERAGSSGLRWIIDPLDGTTNYLYAQPHWCVSIACEDAQGTVIGVVRDPNRAETFTAERGGGAFLNGVAIRVSEVTSIGESLAATGFAYDASLRAEQGAVVATLLPAVRDIRRYGAAALDLAWVACGRFDAYYEAPMQSWDIAAGLLLVREAGGRTAGWRGGVIASAPGIYGAFSDLLGTG